MKKISTFLAALAVALGVAAALLSLRPEAAPTPVNPGSHATSDLPSGNLEPTRVVIPDIGVSEPLQPVGLLPDGAMETPPFGEVGWYDEGPPPGAPGAAVIVAHVHGPQGDDVFARLHELRRHDRFRVDTTLGTVVFEVDDLVQVDKDDLPYDRMWPETDRRLVSLITCGGKRTANGYPLNTIVFAHAI
ncbi:MAG TPA: sortase [Aeromicrobium sp.]|jgi:LPXTG-site transpeptidase (sortase) family protein|nr:sortase [Aeromicrobium sp.]HKY58993.1 sortase [Aeromicrobium sp.]